MRLPLPIHGTSLKTPHHRRRAIARTALILSVVVIIAAALIVGGAIAAANAKGKASQSMTTVSAQSSSSSASPAIQTTDYSSFTLIPGFGNGTTQFEGNDEHVYNYTWAGEIASFDMALNASVIVPPTLYEGLLLVDLSGSPTSGGVAAINMENGTLAWVTTFPNMVMTQPLTYEGLVIVGLGNNVFQNTPVSIRGSAPNYLAAMNASTGNVVWTFATEGEDMPTPLIYEGLIVGANGNGMVYALNALTGGEVWNTSLVQGSYVSMSSMAISGDSIFFGAANPYDFYSVNLASGQVSWSTPTNASGGLDDASPAVWGNVVVTGYTVSTAGGLLQPVLIGMNTTNGDVLWQLDENPGAAPPAIQVPPITIWNGVAYSDPTESGTLYAVNVTSGALLWTFNTGSDTSNANVYEGYLSVVNNAGTVFVLNPTTGALLKETNVGVGLGPGNLIFAGDNVIIASTTGNGQIVSMPLSDVYPSGS